MTEYAQLPKFCIVQSESAPHSSDDVGQWYETGRSHELRSMLCTPDPHCASDLQSASTQMFAGAVLSAVRQTQA